MRSDARKRLTEDPDPAVVDWEEARLKLLLEALADAWDEGYNACLEHVRDGLWGELRPLPDNPYRAS